MSIPSRTTRGQSHDRHGELSAIEGFREDLEIRCWKMFEARVIANGEVASSADAGLDAVNAQCPIVFELQLAGDLVELRVQRLPRVAFAHDTLEVHSLYEATLLITALEPMPQLVNVVCFASKGVVHAARACVLKLIDDVGL